MTESQTTPEKDEREKVIKWLFSGDTGASSKSLAAEFFGHRYEHCYPPLDPSDLGRCLRLIKIAPSVRKCVDSLALKDDRWAKAAKVWDSIAEAMEEEVGIDWSKGKKAPLTYNRMRRAGL